MPLADFLKYFFFVKKKYLSNSFKHSENEATFIYLCGTLIVGSIDLFCASWEYKIYFIDLFSTLKVHFHRLYVNNIQVSDMERKLNKMKYK